MRLTLMFLAAVSAAPFGCGSDDTTTDDDQTPPSTGGADVEAWISAGYYKSWTCESAPHASRNPSVHNYNRICSNTLVSQNATGTGSWPKGAAAVKELYASATATEPAGYAVYVKLDGDSASGANWYWYERDPAMGVLADGKGDSGGAKGLCVACHGAAGSDGAHTPSPGGRDQVYTPVH